MNDVRGLASKKDASIAHVFREAVQFYLTYQGAPEKFEAEMRESMRKELLSDPNFIGLLRKLVKDYPGSLVAVASVVRLELLVTAASTIILSSYMLANLAALVMRYSRLTGYRPTFRVRLTPFLQIVKELFLGIGQITTFI